MPFADLVGHQRATALLQAAIAHNRVAHAYLFHGPDQIGKRRLAIRFIQAMCCTRTAPSGPPDACSDCRSCQQIASGSHPDLCLVSPDRSGATPRIRVEDIRELESRLIYRPLIAERKFCLIDDADRLTIEAANALLKTLEEPPGFALLILVTSRPFALPATIRSRCQALRLIAPTYAETRQALIAQRGLSAHDAQLATAVTEGRLGEAMTLDLDARRTQHDHLATLTAPASLRSISTLLTTADTLAKGDDAATDVLDRLAVWVHDIVLTQLGVGRDHLAHPDHERALRTLADAADMDRLVDVLAEIDTFQRNSARNLNPQLMLEQVLLTLRDALHRAPARPTAAR
ncbi:MAG: DNA polymerase III subunit delta' [Nitrospiraceae bacterium]